jgi:hypothetical protein
LTLFHIITFFKNTGRKIKYIVGVKYKIIKYFEISNQKVVVSDSQRSKAFELVAAMSE